LLWRRFIQCSSNACVCGEGMHLLTLVVCGVNLAMYGSDVSVAGCFWAHVASVGCNNCSHRPCNSSLVCICWPGCAGFAQSYGCAHVAATALLQAAERGPTSSRDAPHVSGWWSWCDGHLTEGMQRLHACLGSCACAFAVLTPWWLYVALPGMLAQR
jgi:hypothetical protein